MKKTVTPILSLLLFIFSSALNAQNSFSELNEQGGDYITEKNDAANPCVTTEQYKVIEKQIAENCKRLGLPIHSQKSASSTLFSWPLRTANGLNDCSYYYIGNYVDEDTTTSGIKDWNCGTVTYDGHRGNDIVSFPYPFYKMDNDELEVIAAAAGTIVTKVDGNFDKNCAMGAASPNYIIVEHADGSCAIYLHMKKNSLTSKVVGQTVVTGEFLGRVGSSGSSSGPHLHFEVWSGTTANTLNDAYSGACNIFNPSTWWITQKPYTEPAITKASVNPIAPVFPACPTTETPNEDSCFTSGQSVKMYIFIRNETVGMVANLSILNPDGTTFASWIHNSTTNYQASYWYWNKVLPAASGTYTFKTVYNGITCSKQFKINCVAAGITTSSDLSQLTIYPNPANSIFTISGEGMENGDYKFSLKNVIGQTLLDENAKIENNAVQKIIPVSDLPEGIYFITIENEKGRVVKKIIKQK